MDLEVIDSIEINPPTSTEQKIKQNVTNGGEEIKADPHHDDGNILFTKTSSQESIVVAVINKDKTNITGDEEDEERDGVPSE